MLKVLHVTPSFYPATHYGGTISSGLGLCGSLAKNSGIQLRVLTTDCGGRHERLKVMRFPERMPEGYDVYYCARSLGHDLSFSLLTRLWRMIQWADVVHLNAVYSSPTIPVLLTSRLMRRPVIWSTQGALQRWPGSTRKNVKFIWEKICNSLCDPERVVLHTTSEEERRASVARISRASAICIPNGIDVTTLPTFTKSERRDTFRLLYLGRLNPIKGIENLFHALAKTDPSVHLSVCGDGDETYRRFLRELGNHLGISDRVMFFGQVSDSDKGAHFAAADVVVVPSYSEAFCMVVAEALAAGLPVIASRGTPWRRLEEMGCGLWVNNDPDSLYAAVKQAREMPLRKMGNKGREWMAREFSWLTIANKMVFQYQRLVKNGVGAVNLQTTGTGEKHPCDGLN